MKYPAAVVVNSEAVKLCVSWFVVSNTRQKPCWFVFPFGGIHNAIFSQTIYCYYLPHGCFMIREPRKSTLLGSGSHTNFNRIVGNDNDMTGID